MSVDGGVTVHLLSDIRGFQTNRWEVRPVFEGGTAKIWNKKVSDWVAASDNWRNLPTLDSPDSELLLRLDFFQDDAKFGNLHFEVYDSAGGEYYKSNPVKIYSSGVLDGYSGKVNAELIALLEEKSHESSLSGGFFAETSGPETNQSGYVGISGTALRFIEVGGFILIMIIAGILIKIFKRRWRLKC